MIFVIHRLPIRYLGIIAAAGLIFCSVSWAITPKQEEELAGEFLKMAAKNFQIIDDPLIVGYVERVGRRIVSVLPVQPFGFHFYVIRSDVYNAFAIPAGHVFINSGLLMAMDSEDELAGILGHEIAHVVARHISHKIERSKKIAAATIAGVVAGVFLGGSGSPEAAQAVTSGALAAGQSLSLAYSREDERQADQLGLQYLEKAGYSAAGLLAVLKKIRGRQWYDSKQFPDYLSTHPGSEERLATIGSWMERNSGKPVSAIPEKTYAFAMVRARLMAEYGEENLAFRNFESAVNTDPEDPVARYGFGLILARKGNLEPAAAQLRHALEKKAFDAYILSDLGRVYFLGGRYAEAVEILKGALSISPGSSDARFLLGRTRMELGDLRGAVSDFESVAAVKPDYPQVSFFLGRTYGELQQLDRAHYYLGIHYKEKGDRKNALFHLKNALSLTGDAIKKERIQQMIQELQKKSKDEKAAS